MPRFDAPHNTRALQLSSLERAHARHLENTAGQQLAPWQQSMVHVSSSPVSVLKRSFLILMVAVMTLFSYPAAIYAEGETPADTPPLTTETTPPPAPAPAPAPSPEPTPPAPEPAPAPPPPAPAPAAAAQASQGPQQPTGADSKKYTYNPQTGLWESDKYTWDPVTKQTKPKTPPTYSYNPSTGMWDTTEWRYDAPSNKYVPNVVSTATPPAGSLHLGPSDNGNNDNAVFNMFYNASISNNITSNAQSGDALVNHNTLGGNALTGDALALANVFNMLQSSASFLGGGQVSTFSSDITGDVFGDLYVDPAVLATLQPANTPGNSNIDINVDTNGQINNNIALAAQTGNATVEGNTTGGNATTGNANAVANIVNMINSAISTGGSFIGMLNIYGNLNGDILLPAGLLNTLLATDAAPATTNLNSGNIESSDVLAAFTNNQAINNNIEATAASGNATVDHNTKAGNATTGDALTNVTVLNLTGRQIVGSNSLLVFVNVLGKWVGVIMDAPAGSTSAALGGGVTQNDTALPEHVQADFDTNAQINNNVSVNAKSGDAAVQNNTKAGDATSGNATASVNLLNIMNSSLNFSNWFGVLFINVFGQWNGSFGVDTEAGELPTVPSAAVASANTGGHGADGGGTKVFRFVPTGNGSQRLQPVNMDGVSADQQEAIAKTAAQALGAQTGSPSGSGPSASSASTTNWLLPSLGLGMGAILLAVERILALRSRRMTV